MALVRVFMLGYSCRGFYGVGDLFRRERRKVFDLKEVFTAAEYKRFRQVKSGKPYKRYFGPPPRESMAKHSLGIRQKIAMSNLPLVELAKIYDISPRTVGRYKERYA